MRKKIRVTDAQVMAARMLAQRDTDRGRTPDAATLRIARAGDQPWKPVCKRRRHWWRRR